MSAREVAFQQMNAQNQQHLPRNPQFKPRDLNQVPLPNALSMTPKGLAFGITVIGQVYAHDIVKNAGTPELRNLYDLIVKEVTERGEKL